MKRTDRTSIGAVSEYTAHHGVLYFYPTPNSGAAVEVSGVFNFTLTSSGSSSGVWTNEAGELILARASSIFMLNYMHDPQGALAMKAYEREVLLSLQEETAQRLLDFNDNEPYILDYSRRRGDKLPKPYEGVAESIYQQSGSGRGGGQGQG
ncbi:MAG: hypothetical protein ACRD5H_00550 [Nitrososphaerales archaeon]